MTPTPHSYGQALGVYHPGLLGQLIGFQGQHSGVEGENLSQQCLQANIPQPVKEMTEAAKIANTFHPAQGGPKVAVYGAGNLGTCILVDMMLQNALMDKPIDPVMIVPRTSQRAVDQLAPLYQYGGMALKDILDDERLYFVPVSPEQVVEAKDTAATTEALQGADTIFVIVPDIASVRTPLLEELFQLDLTGKTLLFSRGGQGGIIEIARMLQKYQPQDVTIAMIEDSPYGVRSDGVLAAKRKRNVKFAAFPESQGPQVTDTLARLFPLEDQHHQRWLTFQPVSPLALILGALNYIAHPTISLYQPNLEKTRQGQIYYHYTDGVDRELGKQMKVLDQERLAVAKAYGVSVDSFPQMQDRQYQIDLYDDYYEMMQACRVIYKSTSPSSIKALKNHRYILEDLPGMAVLIRLAEIAGVEVPETRKHFAALKQIAVEEIGVDPGDLTGYSEALRKLPQTQEQLRAYLSDPREG